VIHLEHTHVTRALGGVDWNFPGARTGLDSVHSLHWFPGNFIPQIPSYLVQILSSHQSIIWDPFCGSGTTGIEAALLGRTALMSDVNSACLLISSGQAAALSSVTRECLERVMKRTEWTRRSDYVGIRGEGASEELVHWFDADTLSQLRYVWKCIEDSWSDPVEYSLLATMFSDVLFRCAAASTKQTSSGLKRRHHWGWIADNVRPRRPGRHDAVTLFRKRVGHVVDLQRSLGTREVGRIRIEQRDARASWVKPGSVDTIITSPPYLGMIDYASANRLTYLWMGWDLNRERQLEIGARARRERKDEPAQYLEAMGLAVRQCYRALGQGGYCAVVIGSSRKFPGYAEKVLSLFGEGLSVIWGPIPRVPTRRRVSERAGTEPVELICVFQKTR
jgi:hypothetical protein